MCKCVPAGRPWIPIRILHGSYVFTADPKCQYFNWNMCKSVRVSLEDQRWIVIRIMDPYNDPTWIPCGGAAGRTWIPIRILHGSHVGAQRAGSGGAWLGGDGKWCSRIGRECALHKTINISFEIFINVYKLSIFHWKYKQFRTVRKFYQNVNISLEISLKIFHLIQNVNISFEIYTIAVGSCADPSKISIFHLKYV